MKRRIGTLISNTIEGILKLCISRNIKNEDIISFSCEDRKFILIYNKENMEEKKVERPLMSVEEFKENLNNNKFDYVEDLENGILHLVTYEAVSKFKSIRRAIRRGHVALNGMIIPKRPFKNKANTCKRKGHHSRSANELKKRIYEQLKH